MNECSEFFRTCPICGKKIFYARKSDLTKAEKRNSVCKSCAVTKSSVFQKGHHLNDSVKRNNTLNRLLEELTPQTFYWVGYLIADGSFDKNSKFEFCLAEKDKKVLEEFSKYINYTNKLMYREKTKAYRISFANSIDNPKFMEFYGFKQRKTYNPIDFEIYKQFDKSLLTALLIGIIDGDGHIEQNGSSNAYAIKITAHKVWEKFYSELCQYLDIPEHIKSRKNSNTLTIGIYKYNIIISLKDFIIQNNLFHLERKWNKLNNLNQDNIDKSIQGAINKRKRAIIQCDLEGNFIKEYDSIKSAVLDGFNASCLGLCLKGDYKQYKGYKWFYKNEK